MAVSRSYEHLRIGQRILCHRIRDRNGAALIEPIDLGLPWATLSNAVCRQGEIHLSVSSIAPLVLDGGVAGFGERSRVVASRCLYMTAVMSSCSLKKTTESIEGRA